MADVKDKVIDIICEKLNVKKEQCTLEATFVDLGADSLDQAELVMEFEEEFDVEISEEENDIGTVGGAIKYIEEASK
ncbi:MAG: acyl carrier protein [Planctomycetota bacterium]|nr:MAG: acyl carrier protein [Planctomycetota bacterium]